MKRRVDLLALALLLLMLLACLALLVQRERRGAVAQPPQEPAAKRVTERPLTRAAPVEVELAAVLQPQHQEPRHPHPLSERHLQLYHEVDLLDGAWQAIEHGDMAEARALVAQHRAEYPGQAEDMNEGLLIVAECLEQPSEDVRERAREFYDTRTFSQMRRRIRRLCLQNPPP